MRYVKTIWILTISLLLTNCAANRSQTGAVLGATTTTATCVEMGASHPAVIKGTRSYLEGPFKCKDYDATIDITNQWPLIGIGNVNRNVVFGTACQMPDGKWVEKR